MESLLQKLSGKLVYILLQGELAQKAFSHLCSVEKSAIFESAKIGLGC